MARDVAEKSLEYLVIGAGPAGLQSAYCLEKSGRDYLVVEAGPAPGHFFTRFPRHRTLISNNKVHTGWTDPELKLRVDWNSLLSEEYAPLFTERTAQYFPPADEMPGYLGDFAAHHRLRVRCDTRITSVTRDEQGLFHAEDQHGNTWRTPRIIVATGVSLPYVPPIEGVEHAERYDQVSVDPADFTDQRVLIIGRGNSAFETAENLIPTAAAIHVAGPGSLNLAWKTHFVGHLRAVNNNFLDTYQLKLGNALLDGRILSVQREPGGGYTVSVSFSRVDEVVKDIRYDRVILATGFRFDPSFFAPECRPRLTIRDKYPELTDAWESVNVPGLYFAGTITQSRDYRKSTSGFIHGFRYGARSLHHILEQRHHGVPWPARELTGPAPGPAAAARAVTDAVVARVNRTSGLWQQFGFLADAVLTAPDGSLRHLEEVPLDHLHRAVADGEFGPVRDYLAVTLEYGADHDQVDPFDVSASRPGQRDTTGLDGRYLHPVVRHFRPAAGTAPGAAPGTAAPAPAPLAEHHLTENLENEWDSEEVHRVPLRRFLTARFSPEGAAPAPAPAEEP
jgi:thioredoxin reductase